MLFLKNTLGLCCSVLGLFICLVYRNTITLLLSTNMINEKIFDGQLITLGDFSVQGQISSSIYKCFKEMLSSSGKDTEENTVRLFQKYFIEQIEQWLIQSDNSNKKIP